LVWRWQIGATADGQYRLQLQALPYSGAFIKGNPAFFTDTTAAVLLQSFEVACCGFDGALCAGPIPRFFSEKPEETLARCL
jgi:hypothetical protein